jgi:hypothetical protein
MYIPSLTSELQLPDAYFNNPCLKFRLSKVVIQPVQILVELKMWIRRLKAAQV